MNGAVPAVVTDCTDALREDVRAAAEAAGWPNISVSPTWRVPAGAASWAAFLEMAGGDALRAVLAQLTKGDA